MKKDLSFKAKKLARMPPKKRRSYYRMKITQHTPPKTAHDEFMLKIYRGLLDSTDDYKALEQIDQESFD